MHIEAVDPKSASDQLLAQVHTLLVAVKREQYPDDEPFTLDEFVSAVRCQPDYCIQRWWVGLDGDTALGRAALGFELAEENQHLADASVDVLPAWRRRAVASQLIGALGAGAVSEGRRLLQIGALEGGAGEGFLTWLGAQKRFVERENRLRVDDLDATLLERWVAAARTEAAGYSLVAWDGGVPAEHLAEFAHLLDVMNDAPRGDLDMEDERNQPEQVAAWDAAIAARGQTMWTIVARHDATGTLAGWTTLLFPAQRKEVAYQLGTGVKPEHRGHGLGRWMKATNALRLLAEKPAVRRIETDNATTNGPMLAINEAMGFRLFETVGYWEVESERVAKLTRTASV